MDPEEKIATDDQQNSDEIKPKKGGRPKALQDRSTKKVTFYVTEEEYSLLTEFASTAWYTFNYSGAARYLVLESLKAWVRKGKKDAR